MSEPVIRVENLGKQYHLGYKQDGERYIALRDVIANKTKRLVGRLKRTNLEVQAPSKDDFWALKDISFEINQGDRVGIVGHNGAGKSTLLKILSRITEPTRGRVRIRGRVASLLEVGTGFHPELTGRENIYLNGAILGMEKAEIRRKFDEIVAFAEVENFLDTPVKRYSSGMYVRLAFAVAAHLDSEVLVVDEVLAVGDSKFQKKCLTKMEDITQKEARTILFVSHNMAVVQSLCSQAFLLERGCIKSYGTTEDVIEHYLESINLDNKIDNEGEYSAIYLDSKVTVKKINAVVKKDDTNSDIFDLQVNFELNSETRLSNIGIGITITDSIGTKVINIPPRMSWNFIREVKGSTICSLSWSSISTYLSGGRYTVHLWVTKDNTEIILVIKDAANFFFSSVDLYGHGVGFEHPKYGIIPAKFDFHYENKFMILS